MKINCPICRCEISLKENVVLDVINTIYHANCYNENSDGLIEWKDFGTFQYIVSKY